MPGKHAADPFAAPPNPVAAPLDADWFTHAFGALDAPFTADVIAVRVALAALFGFLAAVVFRYTLARNRPNVRSMPTTLVLLSALIALVTMVIGDTVARAFGLMAALSIVRFRTAVDDTADTGFVIFAVVLGMAVGSGYTILAAVGLPLVGAAAAIMAWWDKPRVVDAPAVLKVRFGLGFDPPAVIAPHFAEWVSGSTVTAIETATKGTAVEVTYSVKLKGESAPLALVTALNKTDGVQGVELKLG
jgi:hypothetical protein